MFSPGIKEALECGGLYRREALKQVGYFSNRNLHAYEEKELGFRLTHRGWNLERLAQPAVLHHVHQDDSVGLMKKRWRSHYVDGCGELIRASWGKPYFWSALKLQKTRLMTLSGWFALLFGLVLLPWTYWGLALALGAACAFVVLQIARKGSLVEGLLSFLNLQIYAAGFVRGLLVPQVSPMLKVQCHVVSDPTNRDAT